MTVSYEVDDFKRDVELKVDSIVDHIKFNTQKNLVTRESILDTLISFYKDSNIDLHIVYHRGNAKVSREHGRPVGKNAQTMRRIISRRLKERNFKQVSAKTGGYNIVFSVPRE